MTLDHIHAESVPVATHSVAADQQLIKLLKEERKAIAHKNGVPPYAVFQEYSLEDMALKYPIAMDELVAINGVGEGKAKKYGASFIKLIAHYIDENNIVRPQDLIVKTTGVNSALKLYLIQSVDRKLPLDDIASAKGMQMNALLEEMETIVFAGTKLNISYWIDEILDEDDQEELHDYFLAATSDDITEAIDALGDSYDEEELRLYRLKFLSEVAN